MACEVQHHERDLLEFSETSWNSTKVFLAGLVSGRLSSLSNLFLRLL
jgi:hypothetical protein